MSQSMDSAQSTRQQRRLEGILSEYERYKRRRILHAILVSLILVLVFIQVCFSGKIYKSLEQKWILTVQEFLGIHSKPIGLVSDLDSVDSEHVNVVILMAIFTFMYGYDYMIGMATLCKYLVGMIAFKFLSVAMKEPRPYLLNTLDDSSKVLVRGYRCETTFAMPDFAIVQIFWFVLNFSDILTNARLKFDMFIDKGMIYIGLLVMGFLMVIKYVGGQLYILQIIMTLLVGLLLLQVSKYLTTFLRKAIERSTVGASLERQHIIRYYIILICIAVTDVTLLVTDRGYDHTQLKYLENLIQCKLFHEATATEIRKLDPVQSIGVYPTFIRATHFAYMFGVIIGATFAFSNTRSPLTWFHNSKRNKWRKILIVNLWVMLMGAFMYYVDVNGLEFLGSAGINNYWVKVILSFLFSFVAVGAIPHYVFNTFDSRQTGGVQNLGSTFFEWSPQSVPTKKGLGQLSEPFDTEIEEEDESAARKLK